MSSESFHLTPPQPRLFSEEEQLNFLRAAYRRAPDADARRQELATALLLQNTTASINEAIEVLHAGPLANAIIMADLVSALLRRDAPGDAEEALTIADRQVQAANESREKASALTQQARAMVRLNRTAEARKALLTALELEPGHRKALKALNSLNLHEGRADEALQTGDIVVARDAFLPQVGAARHIALARLGRMHEAREVQGLDRFLTEIDPKPPAAWPAEKNFNDALATEILNHPDLRHERRNNATNKTWIVDRPVLARTPALQQLHLLIQQEVTKFANSLPAAEDGEPHPFLANRKVKYGLRDWCVLVDGTGHEEWHIHDDGWLSGVYYIHVPDHIANGTGPGGCLAFGLPENLAGEQAAQNFGLRLVRPHTGLMVLFPSFAYHRTFAHGGDESVERRICFSFDVQARGGQP